MRLDELGEFGFIARVADFVGEPRGAVVVGIGDDAAVLKTSGEGHLLVTTDAFVEGRHFRREWLSAEQIGTRAACAAISDIAAMGGEALAVFVSLGLPGGEEAAFGEQLMRGIHNVATEYDASLAGGDTFASPSGICLDVVVVGQVDRPWLRSAARPGDILLVSGTLGEAAAAFHLLDSGAAPHAEGLPTALHNRFVRPTPQLALAQALAELAAPPAAIDISDGLAQDAGHIAERSEVALTIEADCVPLSPACYEVAAELGADPVLWALTSGEEYELLLAMPSAHAEQAVAQAQQVGVVLTRIGSVKAGSGVTVLGSDGSPIEFERGGWNHFAPQ